MIVKFLCYGVIGWIIEIIYTGSGSLLVGSLKLTGHTYLWMLPIYGCAVFLEPFYERMRSSPWIVRGILWAGIIFLVEYLSGWILQTTIGVCPWDYSLYSRYTLDGFIRLDYFPIWFMSGLLFEKISNFLNRIQVTYTFSGITNGNDNFILLKDGEDFLSSFFKHDKLGAKQ